MPPSEDSTGDSPREIDLAKVVIVGFFLVSFPIAVILELYQSGVVTDELWSFTMFLRDPFLWPFLGLFSLVLVLFYLREVYYQRQKLKEKIE